MAEPAATLAENDRLMLPEIAAQFDRSRRGREQGQGKADLGHAGRREARREVTKRSRSASARGGADARGRRLVLGGAIIRADDMVIDGSVRTRLQRLAESLVG
jgi:F-type H+-transporting ATPase subunit delta